MSDTPSKTSMSIGSKQFKKLISSHIAIAKQINAIIEPLYQSAKTREELDALQDELRSSVGDNGTLDNVGLSHVYMSLALDRLRQGKEEDTVIDSEETKKCWVKDCDNHRHEGKFVGEFCSPCYRFIVLGEGRHSQIYRNGAGVALKALATRYLKDAVECVDPTESIGFTLETGPKR